MSNSPASAAATCGEFFGYSPYPRPLIAVNHSRTFSSPSDSIMQAIIAMNDELVGASPNLFLNFSSARP